MSGAASPPLSIPGRMLRRLAALLPVSRLAQRGNWSLRLRLSLFCALLLITAWLIAAFFAWKSSTEHIDEFFDTQQMNFAKHLAASDFNDTILQQDEAKRILPASTGMQEDEASGFAVFNYCGQMLLHDGARGSSFIFENTTRGFVNTAIQGTDQPWRIVWLNSLDGKRVVAVGQELRYRKHIAFEMLKKQILPWLLLLPALLIGLLWLVSNSLEPLRSVARQLERRPPDDTSHLSAAKLPSEVAPLVQALNRLFSRIAAMFVRERAFISDAAHELRTPLMSLLVQAEVAGLAEDDPATRREALENLLQGIYRSRRLVEQLLTLSRLEALPALGTLSPSSDAGMESSILDWAALLKEAQKEYEHKALARNLSIEENITGSPAPVLGYPAVMALLLRNLFDNAVSYTPENGIIKISLSGRKLRVENTCPPISAAYLARLTERFFRPPGQTEVGSGLGLSIAKRIADMHGLELTFGCETSDAVSPPQAFFSAQLRFR